jgi:hypothetical protein
VSTAVLRHELLAYRVLPHLCPRLPDYALRTIKELCLSTSRTRRGCRGGRLAKRSRALKCFMHSDLINAGSVNSKSAVISNFLASDDFVVLAITETWLSAEPGDDDLRLLCPDGFNVFHSPRMGRTGEGVLILARDTIDVTTFDSPDTAPKSFEQMALSLTISSVCIRLIVVYQSLNHRCPFSAL